MKRIFLSLGMLIGVGAIVAGGTIAFYNDTETSTGNIFVAGSVDLKVDHLKQTYNGEDCTTRCNIWAENVTEFEQGLRRDGSAVIASRSDENDALGPNDTSGVTPDPSPSGFVSLGFGGSITLHFPDGIDDQPGADIRIYEGTGNTSPTYPDEVISVEVSPNGFDWVTVDVNPTNVTFDGSVEVDFDGDAPVVYYVRITDETDPSLFNNMPDADGYDLDAVRALHCNDPEEDGLESEIWQCQLWEETDLTNQTFFNFGDIKPSDLGTNVISLHLEDNDSYSCLIVHNTNDEENSLLETETEVGDAANVGNADGFGELSDYIDLFAWHDLDADGVYEPSDSEVNLYEGDIQSENIPLFLTGGSTNYIGLAWCAGDIEVDDTTGAISCDGAGMLNDAQSDSLTASLTAYAEQERNNPNFSCTAVDLDSEEEGENQPQ